MRPAGPRPIIANTDTLMPSTAPGATKPPINWPATLMLSMTALPVVAALPVYLWFADPTPWVWFWAGLLLAANGMSITAGYHRLWAHRAYKAHPALKWLFAFLGGMAVQNSILIWATNHRQHHAHVDDDHRDPYSASRGFWYSHIGWMLRNYPGAEPDYSRARDLLDDPIVAFQHKHYLWFAFGSNIGVVLLLGALFGDMLGFVLIAGFARLFVSHHFTFFINSLAHIWGRQPYTRTNSARDNDFLAFLTWGEGYHNYHHIFQADYRNGIRWWQFDPTKWLIATAARLGLASDLRRVPEFKIRRQIVSEQFERARAALETQPAHGRLAELRTHLDEEWQQFSHTLAEWTALRSKELDSAKQQLRERWEASEFKRELRALERALEEALREQQWRMQALSRQLGRQLVAA